MKKSKLFEDYITENIDSAYRFAFTYVRNKEDAEDILNESVVKAIKGINSLREPKHIKSWFFRIIANTAINYIRRQGKIVYLDYDDMEHLQKTEDDYSDLNFNELIEKLDQKYKSIIVLRFFENMTLQEIAQVLDTNENTVKTRLYKALKILKVDVEEAI